VAVIAAAVSCGLLLSGTLSVESGASQDTTGVHGTAKSHMPLDVLLAFSDREKRYDALGPNYVQIDESFVDSDNNCDFCYGLKYDSGPHEKAFVAFRSSGPVDLGEANTLLFDARGEEGGETITVYAVGKRVEESERNSGTIGLEFAFSKQIIVQKEWKEYQVDLASFELAGVTHGFAFEVLKGSAESQTVYFDNIYYDVARSDYAINLN
jgi:hypothetical protein